MPVTIRGGHTFSIPASINEEVPCGSFQLDTISLPVSFSTSNPEELGFTKFSRLFFHLATSGIHPLTDFIVIFYFTVVVAPQATIVWLKYVTHSLVSILDASHVKRGVTPSSCTIPAQLAPSFSHELCIPEEFLLF